MAADARASADFVIVARTDARTSLGLDEARSSLHQSWKAEPGTAPDGAFRAHFGDVTYHVETQTYGYPAYVEVRGQRGGLRRLDLGLYVTMVQAQQACERHYKAGCDLSKAEKIIR
jgi:hypothetical protein